MNNFPTPVPVFAGNQSPEAPLVMLFHGRGSTANEIISLANYLPQEARYVAINAPIFENGGFAWFANRGIGRPIAESLDETTSWFENWLKSIINPGQKVLLIGNSGGGAFIGGLIGRSLTNYSGAAILYATLPWEAGIEWSKGKLKGFPVFVAHGENDRVIPADLLNLTWSYLEKDSQANLTKHRGPEGHGLTQESAEKVNTWVKNQISQ